jgi:hypothetical protein
MPGPGCSSFKAGYTTFDQAISIVLLPGPMRVHGGFVAAGRNGICGSRPARPAWRRPADGPGPDWPGPDWPGPDWPGPKQAAGGTGRTRSGREPEPEPDRAARRRAARCQGRRGYHQEVQHLGVPTQMVGQRSGEALWGGPCRCSRGARTVGRRRGPCRSARRRDPAWRADRPPRHQPSRRPPTTATRAPHRAAARPHAQQADHDRRRCPRAQAGRAAPSVAGRAHPSAEGIEKPP